MFIIVVLPTISRVTPTLLRNKWEINSFYNQFFQSSNMLIFSHPNGQKC